MRLPRYNPSLATLGDIVESERIVPVVTGSHLVRDAVRRAVSLELKLAQAKREIVMLERDVGTMRQQREDDIRRQFGMVYIPSVDSGDSPAEPFGIAVIKTGPISIRSRIRAAWERLSGRGLDPQRWACPKCGDLHNTKGQAWRCLKSHDAPCACGAEKARYATKCSRCQEIDRLRKAVKVSDADYSGPVFSDDLVGYNDGYFLDTGEFASLWGDHVAYETVSGDMPCYVWACNEHPFRVDAEDVLSGLDDCYEDAWNDVVDQKGIEDFISAWNAKQTIVSWEVDYSRVVVLDQDRFNALIGWCDAPNNQAR